MAQRGPQSIREVRGRAARAACAGWAGLALAPAAAAGGERVDLGLELGSRTPGTPTPLALDLRFKPSGDPDGKPSPIRSAAISAPPGTRFDLGAVPACKATDEELRALARDACPAASRIGAGALTAVTGFGPPVDPFEADLTLFNTPSGFVELVTDRGSGRTLGFDRATVEGNTATLAPPRSPGGPPDGETAVRRVAFTIDAPGYVRTPPDCPADGHWRSTGTFGFADGVTATEGASTPC
ncbi:MAG: hypothetical protein M3P50_03285, partial [Actinomycetota bacterium]|nr:hypothetical protein [Actinomycetota bacterium]